jgi:hypothetical protein
LKQQKSNLIDAKNIKFESNADKILYKNEALRK